MKLIYLALGSNVGDKTGNIQKAILLLKENISNVKTTNYYETIAVGVTDQDNFVNTVIEGTTELSTEELLHYIKGIEKQVGRIKRFHWGPREIDIDILFYGNLVLNTDDLRIPHPRLQERDFVLKPLSDLAPQLVHPVYHKTIVELLKELPQSSASVIRVI